MTDDRQRPFGHPDWNWLKRTEIHKAEMQARTHRYLMSAGRFVASLSTSKFRCGRNIWYDTLFASQDMDPRGGQPGVVILK